MCVWGTHILPHTPNVLLPSWPQGQRGCHGEIPFCVLAPENEIRPVRDSLHNRPVEERPSLHVSLFEQLPAGNALEESCIRREIWQGQWWGGRLRAEAAGGHSAREGSMREELGQAGSGNERSGGGGVVRESRSRGPSPGTCPSGCLYFPSRLGSTRRTGEPYATLIFPSHLSPASLLLAEDSR